MRVDLEHFHSAKFLSVSALNRYINYKFDSDIHLQEVYLRGEISNFKISGKHAYFSLKDEFSVISAMIFNYQLLGIDFDMQDGIIVQVVGTIKVYEKRGSYSIVINHIERDGIGRLYQEFLELKEKLQKEGLFDIAHKLPLPEYPLEVAVVTAATGDAIHDIISTFNRRLPLAKITLYPALVQGLDAPKDLVRALKEVYRDNKADVIIIGRGGGSYEDLACFNDELLARTLFSSPIPTVSAIGHEADYTICDYIASFRAPTPTGAAMVLTKEKRDVLENINGFENRLNIAIKNVIIKNANSYAQIIKSYGLSNYLKVFKTYEDSYIHTVEKLEKFSPKNILDNNVITVDNLTRRLEHGYLNKVNYLESSYNRINDKLRGEIILDGVSKNVSNVLQKEEKINLLFTNKLNKLSTQLDNLIDKAIILNPLNLMSKGYAIAYQDEKVVDSVDNIKKDLPFIVRLKNGKVITRIEEIQKSEE